ncbi:single-stranded DNA-binding protein [soil metagenome]
MANVAKITLVGNVGRDLETRYTPQGTLAVNFSLAVNNRRRDASGNQVESTNWYRVNAFGRVAETMVNLSERGFLSKGKQVFVEGRFEAREYQSQDGQTRTSLDVTVGDFSGFQLLGQRGDDGGSGGSGSNNYDNDRSQSQQPENRESDDMDDVPF